MTVTFLPSFTLTQTSTLPTYKDDLVSLPPNMADQDPSPSLTTHLLAALNELQAVQQKTQRDLDAEKTNSR